ncbi:MAG: virulence factor SrfC family protein [Pseudomonadota bacterium]
MTTQDQLVARCQQVADASRNGLAWVLDEANADTVGPDRKSLIRQLRRAARRAEKLGKAAGRKMSVSVFGPSQAGKSFLVSVLARPANGRLVANFPGPGGNLDYISEVNPEGEGESTGLVTRFTMSQDPTPDGYPIKLVLLSVSDIARTIINSFYNDGDQSETPPEPSEIAAHLDTYRGKMGGEGKGLAFEDVLEIADYVNGTFARSAYTMSLRSFWEDAAEIAPRLSPQDQAAFLSILWGKYDALTALYAKLAEALGTVGFAEEVHVPLSALTPRETSIIDVKTLHNLMAPDDDTLNVITAQGQTFPIGRSALCALAAELVMPMQEQPSDIFGRTDLLDFPGARNRFERPLSETLKDPEAAVSQLLLRGKVSYLFDRYVENQEITSMLLCVPDSNMETLDLPGLIETWIALTHGSTPKQRALADCILFFVLTKFDKHLGESAASGGAQTRFQRRMEASLEKFGKAHDPWVDTWTPNTPFQNCFWLRNPNFFVEGLIEYDDSEREVRVRPEKEARLAELREGCLSAELVQRHFAEPEAAWDAALTLNDGGVSYLIGKLTEVCKPESKITQISGQLEKLATDLVRALEAHYVSDDVEARIEEKRQSAQRVIDALEYALDSHRFGAVMSSLCVDQDAIMERISHVPSYVRLSSAVAPAAAPVSAGIADSSAKPARRRIRPGAASPSTPAPDTETEADADVGQATADSSQRIRTMTPETFQAQTAVEVWIDVLKQFSEATDRLRRFGFDESVANDLVQEMIHGMRRTGVIDHIERQVSSISFGHTLDKQAHPASIVCAEEINAFVAYLGTDRQPEADRPSVQMEDGTTRPVFHARPLTDSADSLPDTQTPTAEETWTDWVHALDAMFLDNAKEVSAGTFDIEQNLKLGRIIGDLRTEEDV